MAVHEKAKELRLSVHRLSVHRHPISQVKEGLAARPPSHMPDHSDIHVAPEYIADLVICTIIFLR